MASPTRLSIIRSPNFSRDHRIKRYSGDGQPSSVMPATHWTPVARFGFGLAESGGDRTLNIESRAIGETVTRAADTRLRVISGSWSTGETLCSAHRE